ncbi:ExbD/TolR family protein [Bacteroidota bacterium]
MARKKKKMTDIPQGAMADIAFLLLIFFLVTTTMSVDSGIYRKLPQWAENQKDDEQDINERNILQVLINRNNELNVNGQPRDLSELKNIAKEFLLNPYNKAEYSEKEDKEVEFFGTIAVSKGVISLQNDKSTEYGPYIEVQNELVACFNELKDELSSEKWGMKYADLTEDQQEAVNKVRPAFISEAEPVETNK